MRLRAYWIGALKYRDGGRVLLGSNEGPGRRMAWMKGETGRVFACLMTWCEEDCGSAFSCRRCGAVAGFEVAGVRGAEQEWELDNQQAGEHQAAAGEVTRAEVFVEHYIAR